MAKKKKLNLSKHKNHGISFKEKTLHIKDDIIEALANGENKKTIANRFNLTVCEVLEVSKLYYEEYMTRRKELEAQRQAKLLEIQNCPKLSKAERKQQRKERKKMKYEEKRKSRIELEMLITGENSRVTLADIIPEEMEIPLFFEEPEEKPSVAEELPVFDLPKEEGLTDFKSVMQFAQKRRKREPIPARMLEFILADVNEGSLTQKAIAEMYHVSETYISRLKKGGIKLVDVQQTTLQDPVIQEVPPQKRTRQDRRNPNSTVVDVQDLLFIPTKPKMSHRSEKKIIDQVNKIFAYQTLCERRIPVSKYVTCGMVAERHDMPVKEYIFENIDYKTMFDYNQQLKIARQRIVEIVQNEDGTRADGLFVYVTGLTCALSTIIRTCQELKLNLTLLHYNKSDGKYHYQEMITENHSTNRCPGELMSLRCKKLYTFDVTATDFVKQGRGWEIIEQRPSGLTTLDREITLFTSKEAAWTFYVAVCNNESAMVNVYMNEVEIDHNKQYRKVKPCSTLILPKSK